MVSLIAAADPQPDGGYAPAAQALEPRLATPHSGLYAQIRSPGHEWRSPSTVGLASDFGPLLANGGRDISYASFGHDRVAIESRAIQFEDNAAARGTLTFSVAVSLSPYEEQLWRFRRELFGWFLGLMLALLVTLAVLLHWVLAPVRRMEREIHEVEEGRSEGLGGGYPRELAGVAGNLNALLVGERKRVSRYRDTLGNLAHSLKTPLAVLRAQLPAGGAGGALSSRDRPHERHHRAPAEARRGFRRCAARGSAGRGRAGRSGAARGAS